MNRIAWIGTLLVAGGCVALATSFDGPVRFMGDVSVGSWSALTGLSLSRGSGGSWTNAPVTNWYRVSGTNVLGRLPVSSNLVGTLPGNAATSSITLRWPRLMSVQRWVIERTTPGAGWTNWLTLSAGATNWTDHGTSVWTHSLYTNLYAEIASPTNFPWPAADDFVRVDGTAAMEADFSLGNNSVTNVASVRFSDQSDLTITGGKLTVDLQMSGVKDVILTESSEPDWWFHEWLPTNTYVKMLSRPGVYQWGVKPGEWAGWELSRGVTTNNVGVFIGYAVDQLRFGWAFYSSMTALQDKYAYAWCDAPLWATKVGTNGIVCMVMGTAVTSTLNRVDFELGYGANGTNIFRASPYVAAATNKWRAYRLTGAQLPAAWTNAVPVWTNHVEGIKVERRGIPVEATFYSSNSNRISAAVMVDWD